jgi:hypothetical protein
MKWITTNIRFPEDMYMDLKMEAAKKRTSVAEVVRAKILTKKTSDKKSSTEVLMKKFDKIAGEIDKQNKGVNLSEKLIEMRYEQ